MSCINIKIFMNTSVESDKCFLETVTAELSHPSINQSECIVLFMCDCDTASDLILQQPCWLQISAGPIYQSKRGRTKPNFLEAWGEMLHVVNAFTNRFVPAVCFEFLAQCHHSLHNKKCLIVRKKAKISLLVVCL